MLDYNDDVREERVVFESFDDDVLEYLDEYGEEVYVEVSTDAIANKDFMGVDLAALKKGDLLNFTWVDTDPVEAAELYAEGLAENDLMEHAPKMSDTASIEYVNDAVSKASAKAACGVNFDEFLIRIELAEEFNNNNE